MRSLRFLLPFLAPALLGAPPPAQADEVHLTGGSVLRGQVLRTGKEDAAVPVRLLLPGGDVLELAAADVRRVWTPPDAPAPGKHLRHVPPTDVAQGGLDVALTHYVHPDGGPRLDLLSAVHIAEASYFQRVQRLLDRADVVLYEGVKPKDSTAADLQKPMTAEENPVRALQNKLAQWFGLVFQLDEIDYTRKHFVHADLTMEQFTGQPATGAPAEPGPTTTPAPDPGSTPKTGAGAGLQERTKGLMKLFKLFGPVLDLLLGDAEGAGPARRRLKAMFAHALGTVDMQKAMNSFAPEMSDLVLTKRNAVVIERILEQRKKKNVKSIAVFYGAAHMSGIEDELVRLGYKRASARWLRAWELD